MTDTTTTMDDLPDYRIAAENHNYGNGNAVSYDPSTWGDAVGNLGKFAVSSVVAGWDSLANTAISVGNIFADESNKIQKIDTIV